MTKAQLVEQMAIKAEITKKDAEKALASFQEIVTETLVAGDKISLVGFGTFEVADRAARVGRNPKTGEELQIEACKSPKFKAGSKLKSAVKGE